MIWEHHAREAEFALRAVRAAADVCREVRRGAMQQPLSKADASPVTVADFASQALIAGWLAESFPADPLVAEEDSRLLQSEPGIVDRVVARVRQVRPEVDAVRLKAWVDRGGGEIGERFWTLDPIDGTKGFVRGDQYVVALALLEAGNVVVAALAAPSLGVDLKPRAADGGCVVIAVRGQGSWAVPLHGDGGRRLTVSSCDTLAEARLLRSFEDDHTDPEQLARISGRLGMAPQPIRMDSQAKYLVIAGGQAELLIRLLPQRHPSYKEKLWDVAAGLLVVEEAGGRVSDLAGRPLDVTTGRELSRNHGSLISNGRLHDAVLLAVSAVSAEASP